MASDWEGLSIAPDDTMFTSTSPIPAAADSPAEYWASSPFPVFS